MVLQTDKGLFAADFLDHYAILGIPVDIEPKDIRKAYLKIARRLHPDSSALTSDADRQLASQLLSKWVNPAWESLSQEKLRTEYNLLLKMKGQAGQESVHLNSTAQQLLTAPNPDFFYRSALSELTKRQFEDLENTVDVTSRISEVNLAYIMRKSSAGDNTISSTRPLYTMGAQVSEEPMQAQPGGQSGSATAEPPRPVRRSLAEPYLQRSQMFYKKGDFVRAIRELREGLAIDPKHGPSHSLLGLAYLKQKQPTMAKIHFNKALELDPNDQQAKEGKRILASQAPATTNASPARRQSGGGQSDNFFSRLIQSIKQFIRGLFGR